MYDALSKALFRTRKSFTAMCKEMNIDPEWTDPDMLSVISCDNCSWWEKPTNMIEDEYGTVFCIVCDNLDNLKF